jgi:hypothetical protein
MTDLRPVLAQYQRSLVEARAQRDILALAINDACHTLRCGALTPEHAALLAAMLEGAVAAAGGPFTEPAPATSNRDRKREKAGSTGAGSPLETP